MTVYSARKKIAIIWITLFFIQTIFLIIQSVSFFEDEVSSIWKWFLPHILPTITLILAVFSQTKKEPKKEGQSVSLFQFRLCLAFSFTYLLLLTFLCISGPLALDSGKKPLEYLKESNIWLASLQTLTGTSIGWFFWKNKNKAKRIDDPPKEDKIPQVG